MFRAEISSYAINTGSIQLEKSNSEPVEVVRRALLSAYPRYRSMAMRRLRDGTAADDVVQAFALKALERAPQLKNLEAVHGWLRRLFETTLIDFCRLRSFVRRREITFEVDVHDRVQNTFAEQGSCPEQAIPAILSCLKMEYADVIYRLDLSDQSMKDVARQLGITVNNLTVRAHRARRALRGALEAMPISMKPRATL
jgi:RNA polymerase sigma-70 factor (ECF subfamily)